MRSWVQPQTRRCIGLEMALVTGIPPIQYDLHYFVSFASEVVIRALHEVESMGSRLSSAKRVCVNDRVVSKNIEGC